MIERLRLENFKAFRQMGLPLAPLTLLSGVNAAGKSTTMQALALLRQSYDAGVFDHRDGLLLNGELVELGVGQDVLHENYADGGHEGRIFIAIAATIDGSERTWRVEYRPAQDREADLLEMPPVVRPSDRQPPPRPSGLFGAGFQYLRADRIVPAVTYPKSFEMAVRRGFLGVRGEHTVNYLRARHEDRVSSPELRHPAAKSTGLLDQTEAWLREICPGVDLMAEDLRGTDMVRLSYGFGGTAGITSSNIRYRPTNVGFGLTYALPIIVACLSAGPGRLVMLENPEAHLHPRGQTMVARLSCRAVAAGGQLIIESHSDHVLNGVRLAVKDGVLTPNHVALHYFDRNDDGEIEVSSPEIDPDGMLSQWPRGFFDEWDRALDRLLD
ncbi:MULTISPECIES: AAA family ATPase [unclassified Micromonospora]|uniref:AAA family ATPase n=1 Tax=unclassified Micromonospora TaxID=2617518 RepID=UPI002FF03965